MSHSVWRSLAQPAALPASWAYGTAVGVRNWLYQKGTFPVKSLPVPVVSVGNITVGGSGKTPMVAHIAGLLLARGRAVGVISRGYRRASASRTVVVSEGQSLLATVTEGGDEPVELAERVPGLAVAVGGDRYQAGMELLRRRGDLTFILDDGFQHRQLSRDLDLVCIDAEESVECLRLLPAGTLREPLPYLERAGALIWTRWREGRPSEPLASRILRSFTREHPVFRSVSTISGFRPLAGTESGLPAEGLRGKDVGLLSGIAKPQRFRQDLEACGARVVWSCAKRDHYKWQPDEVSRLVASAQRSGAQAVITTGKDAVKMSGVGPTVLPLYRAELQARILEQEAFENLLETLPRLAFKP